MRMKDLKISAVFYYYFVPVLLMVQILILLCLLLSLLLVKAQLWHLAQRTTALPLGRGAFTLATISTLLTEVFFLLYCLISWAFATKLIFDDAILFHI